MNPAPHSAPPSPTPQTGPTPQTSAPNATSQTDAPGHAPQTKVPSPTPQTSASSAAHRTNASGGAPGAGVSGFRADAESLRGDATAVADFAGRVSGAAARLPSVVPAPRWATTGAAIRAADTARRLLSALAHDITETADRIRAVAADYEEADVRAAARLRATR